MVCDCIIVGCSNNNIKNPDKRFFSVPLVRKTDDSNKLSERRRREWIRNINRSTISFETARPWQKVCSDHFISGKPAALRDHTNPDWAPTLKMGHHAVHVSTSNSHNDATSKKRMVKFEEQNAKGFGDCDKASTAGSGGNEMETQTEITMDIIQTMEFEVSRIAAENTILKKRHLKLKLKRKLKSVKIPSCTYGAPGHADTVKLHTPVSLLKRTHPNQIIGDNKDFGNMNSCRCQKAIISAEEQEIQESFDSPLRFEFAPCAEKKSKIYDTSASTLDSIVKGAFSTSSMPDIKTNQGRKALPGYIDPAYCSRTAKDLAGDISTAKQAVSEANNELNTMCHASANHKCDKLSGPKIKTKLGETEATFSKQDSQKSDTPSDCKIKSESVKLQTTFLCHKLTDLIESSEYPDRTVMCVEVKREASHCIKLSQPSGTSITDFKGTHLVSDECVSRSRKQLLPVKRINAPVASQLFLNTAYFNSHLSQPRGTPPQSVAETEVIPEVLLKQTCNTSDSEVSVSRMNLASTEPFSAKNFSIPTGSVPFLKSLESL